MEEKMRWLKVQCPKCGQRVNTWDQRISKTLAYKQINCEKCIADVYDIDVVELRRKMEYYFDIRPCIGV